MSGVRLSAQAPRWGPRGASRLVVQPSKTNSKPLAN
jgi:hypothetical protein